MRNAGATARKESTATFTSFLRTPKPMLERLRREDVVLRRRQGAPIRLSLETRASATTSGTEVAACLLAELFVHLPKAPETVDRALASRFPWMKFLPVEARKQFVTEFVETVKACASIQNDAALDELVRAWKSTAAIYADPKLAAELQRPVRGSSAVVARP